VGVRQVAAPLLFCFDSMRRTTKAKGERIRPENDFEMRPVDHRSKQTDRHLAKTNFLSRQ
jgi:hypothetical protein